MEAMQMAIHARVAEQHRHHAKTTFFVVWGALLLMTGIEVMLAYQRLEPVRMLSFLMGLDREGRAHHRLFHAHEV